MILCAHALLRAAAPVHIRPLYCPQIRSSANLEGTVTPNLFSLREARQTDDHGGYVIAVVPLDLPPLRGRRFDQVLGRLPKDTSVVTKASDLIRQSGQTGLGRHSLQTLSISPTCSHYYRRTVSVCAL